jgi:hypothetical protein
VLGPDEDLTQLDWNGETARTIVVVDALPHLGAREASATSAPWSDVVRVARGPKRPRVVLCTARSESAEAKELRKSGIAFVLVRTGTLVLSRDLGLENAQGRTVHVVRDLPVPELGLTPLDELASALADACVDPSLAGRVLDVRHTSAGAWLEVVRSFGAKPKPTSRMMARFFGFFGRPALTQPGANSNSVSARTSEPFGGVRHEHPSAP